MSAMNQNNKRAINESDVYVKNRHGVPRDFLACEAAGLGWLREGEADGGARVVDVPGVSGRALELRRIESTAPNPQAAYGFGKSLATTYNLGAAGWDAGPGGWEEHGYFGPLDQPLQMDLTPRETFDEYWVKGRLLPALGKSESSYNNRQLDIFDQFIDRLLAGDFNNEPDAARVHGDLWWGNLMWDADGTILIDPAVHGGTREEDLALLALFGTTHFNEILHGYESVYPLPDFAEGCELHQLYAVLMHTVLFGGGYAGQAAATAAKYVR